MEFLHNRTDATIVLFVSFEQPIRIVIFVTLSSGRQMADADSCSVWPRRVLSRGVRDDDRANFVDRAPTPTFDHRASRIDDVPADGLSLPRGEERDRVEHRGREYSLNGSETRALSTVGAFRVVSPDDFGHDQAGRGVSNGDWRHLAEQGLVTRESLTDHDGVRHVVALTRDGKDLLDAHSTTRPDGRRQEYYAGVVKPRELRHDAQLYRVYREEAARIEREGGRVTRIVLDYELKRDYQQFLNRDDRDADADLTTDRLAFADAHDLTVVKGHLELPDLSGSSTRRRTAEPSIETSSW